MYSERRSSSLARKELLASLADHSSDLPESRLATANLKPRPRMTTLSAFANQFDYRVLGTGKTDDDGKIVHNRDYWDSRSFPEMPAGPENPDLAELQAKHS